MTEKKLAELIVELDEVIQADCGHVLSNVDNPTAEALVRIGIGTKLLGAGIAQLLINEDAAPTAGTIKAAMRAGAEHALAPVVPTRAGIILKSNIRSVVGRMSDMLATIVSDMTTPGRPS